ncbi:MAG: tol-pal system protein YbgF [Rhodovibrionaceae bacterium]
MLGLLAALFGAGPLGLVSSVSAQTQQLAQTETARLELRIQQLEDQVRSLTGQVEELSYKLNQLQAANSAPQPQSQPQSQSQGYGASTGGTSQSAAANAQGATGQAEPGQPQVFGTVNQSSVDAVRSQAPSQDQTQSQTQYQEQQSAANVQLPSGTPKEQYDYAFDLLRQANYPAAEQAFQAFLQRHPSDPLSGNAKYWLGESYYVRGDNQNAAIVFAEGFQEYPNSSKAPDNLLKLGMALANLGSTEDACGTFSELQRRYPNAASTILRRAEREQSRLGCG